MEFMKTALSLHNSVQPYLPPVCPQMRVCPCLLSFRKLDSVLFWRTSSILYTWWVYLLKEFTLFDYLPSLLHIVYPLSLLLNHILYKVSLHHILYLVSLQCNSYCISSEFTVLFILYISIVSLFHCEFFLHIVYSVSSEFSSIHVSYLVGSLPIAYVFKVYLLLDVVLVSFISQEKISLKK